MTRRFPSSSSSGYWWTEARRRWPAWRAPSSHRASRLGCADGGRPPGLRLLSSAQERGIARYLVIGNLAGLAEVRLGQRDFAATLALAEDILGRTKDIPATFGKAQAYLLLARAALRRGSDWSSERIEAWLAEAESQVRQTGYAMLGPDILECRAELAAARGEEAGRAAHLREALRLCTAVGADGHAARLSRSLDEASATA